MTRIVNPGSAHRTRDLNVPTVRNDDRSLNLLTAVPPRVQILNAVSSEDKQRITYDGLKHEILNEAVGGVQVANNIITFIKGRL